MLVFNRTTGTNGEQSKFDHVLVEAIWITGTYVNKPLCANYIICGRVRMTVKDEVGLWIPACQSVAEEWVERCAEGENNPEMIKDILPHAKMAVRHDDFYPVNFKLKLHGSLVSLEPVAVALYIANRGNHL